jgi:hypothetical protein
MSSAGTMSDREFIENARISSGKEDLYLHVSHEAAEHVAQLVEDDFTLLLPPPIPKEETHFWISLLPHSTQTTFFSLPMEMSVSKRHPQTLHENS